MKGLQARGGLQELAGLVGYGCVHGNVQTVLAEGLAYMVVLHKAECLHLLHLLQLLE